MAPDVERAGGSEPEVDAEEVDWVAVRRYSDALEAEMARDFLRDHGVHALLRGNNVTTSVLNHVSPVVDARLMVAPADLGQAEEVLRGLAAQARHVYRDPASPLELDELAVTEGAAELARPRPRVPLAAVPFALIFPIGSGHFYACHYAAGAVFGISIVGSVFLGFANGEAWRGYAAVLIVLADGLLGVRAARRHNEGRVPTPAAQAVFAAVVVVACTAIARISF